MQCTLHFLTRPGLYRTQQAKVMFIIANLGGAAAQWATPLVMRNNSVLRDFDAFIAAFRGTFERRYLARAQQTELLTLKQGNRDLVAYLAHFQRLATETILPDLTKSTIFYQGLREDLKDRISQVVPQPSTCAELIDLALQIDQRQRERRTEKRGGDGYVERRGKEVQECMFRGEGEQDMAPEPMQVGGMRRRLTDQEYERRRKRDLCLFCGKAGHYSRACPQKGRNPKEPGNAWGRSGGEEQ